MGAPATPPGIRQWIPHERFSIYLIVYRKGDIVKGPMKSRDVVPKNVPGVGWVMQG